MKDADRRVAWNRCDYLRQQLERIAGDQFRWVLPGELNRAHEQLEALVMLRPDQRAEPQHGIRVAHVDRVEVDANARRDGGQPLRDRRAPLVRLNQPSLDEIQNLVTMFDGDDPPVSSVANRRKRRESALRSAG